MEVPNTVTRGQWLDSELNLSQRTDSRALVQKLWTVSQTGLTCWQCWSPESLRAGAGKWGGWYQEAEACLMKLGFTHSLRMCVFLEQSNSEERSLEWISLENPLCPSKNENKTFHPFKNEQKERRMTELLVKCRKSYHVWMLVSDACLERGDWDLDLKSSFSLSALNGAEGKKEEHQEKWSFERWVLTSSHKYPQS